jgi:hypothetical protein
MDQQLGGSGDSNIYNTTDNTNNSETVENSTQSVTNENLNPNMSSSTSSNTGAVKMDISNLLSQIMSITNQSLKDAQER